MAKTHAELSRTAIGWLYEKGCSIFTNEIPTWNGIADAIGVVTNQRPLGKDYKKLANDCRKKVLELVHRAGTSHITRKEKKFTCRHPRCKNCENFAWPLDSNKNCAACVINLIGGDFRPVIEHPYRVKHEAQK